MKIYTKGVLVKYNDEIWTIKRLKEDKYGQTRAVLENQNGKLTAPIENLQSIDE